MRHIRCCVASEPPLPELVAAALAQQLEAGRVDLFLDSLSLAAHSAALAAAQLTPAAQRAAGLLPGALRLLPGSSGGGSSALRLRAQLQQGDRAATLALAFHAAGYTLLQLQPSPAGGATASVPAWATQLWQRLEQQMPSFASVEAAAAAPPAQPADQKPPAPALVQVPQLQQAWVHQQDLAQAISAVLQAVGAPPVPT